MHHYETVSYMSGTVIVVPRGVVASNTGPHLYVHYSNDYTRDGLTEDENQRKRVEVADALAAFLNGGPAPEFLKDWQRESPDTLRNNLGGSITATGPMILPPDDNGRLAWMQDNSEHAQQARKALVDRLDVSAGEKS